MRRALRGVESSGRVKDRTDQPVEADRVANA